MLLRRRFLQTLAGGCVVGGVAPRAFGQDSVGATTSGGTGRAAEGTGRVEVKPLASADEDIPGYVRRVAGGWDETTYRKLLGAANEFKEGDEIIGVAAADEASRRHARELLANTSLEFVDRHPPHRDQLQIYIGSFRSNVAEAKTRPPGTFGELKRFLLEAEEGQIHAMKDGLSSDVIACVVKLMSDAELTAISAKVFNPLPGTRIGARGYLGARVQPNSPTDHPDDIRWQVLDAFAYGVGDVLLGTNPVSSDVDSVLAVEETLKEVLATFGLTDAMPHCVLAHVDVQAEVERAHPGSTALWFQSIAGNDTANATFDISVDKMKGHAGSRLGPYGFYFETGQGADFTNGHGHGCDMVLHESRKYGFARALSDEIARAKGLTDRSQAWVHLNDVAGFIGPEVFRTREQLVRCCLEDLVMGKLHGLTIGLDVCSTLHMDVSLSDLDWCLEQVAPAAPAYLMALPTKIDPMLGYLTTGYQDHVRLRERFDLKVNDRMANFFASLGIVDQSGRPGPHFGDPLYVYLQYRLRKGDGRDAEEIVREGRRQMAEVRGRGVFLAEGHGAKPSDLQPQLAEQIESIYADAKRSIWLEWDAAFVAAIPQKVELQTRSADRTDYILHPTTGEVLADASEAKVKEMRALHGGRYDVQLVVSEGLNASALTDPGNLLPLIRGLVAGCDTLGMRVAPELLVVHSGRVRAGYRIGQTLFADLPGPRTILHIIGERPGSGHHTMSVYVTRADGAAWGAGKIDHDITRVVSGIATTTLDPQRGAADVIKILSRV